jgi:NADH:ubiquinone oxidoreductase subunit C
MAYLAFRTKLCRTPRSVEKNNNNGEQTPEPNALLDEKGRLLETLLPNVLSAFDVSIGISHDLMEVIVEPADVVAVCENLKNHSETLFNYLTCLSVVDYVEHLQVVYHLYSTQKKHKVVVKANVSSEEPSLPSVTSVWKGSDWYEREGHDLFGVIFESHPGLAPLILYEGFEGYPGRKSFPLHDYKEW